MVRSVVINVYANHIEAEDSVLINVTATRIIAPRGCILYNVIDTSEEGIVLTENEVRVGVFSEDKPPLIMRSSTTIDGGNYCFRYHLPVSFFNYLFIREKLGEEGTYESPKFRRSLQRQRVCRYFSTGANQRAAARGSQKLLISR